MAGRPIKHTQVAMVDEIGDEKVFDTYIKLGSIAKTVEHLGIPNNVVFHNWVKAGPPERQEAWKLAKKAKAWQITEEMMDDVITNENAKAMSLLDRRRQWFAEALNKEEFGKQTNVNVTQTQEIGPNLLQALDSYWTQQPKEITPHTEIEGE